MRSRSAVLQFESMPSASKALKIFLVLVGVIVGVAVLAAILFWLFFDINRYKPRIEAAMSKVLSMNVAIEGPLALGVASGVQVKMEKVRVSNRGDELAFVEELHLSIPLMSVISDEMVYSATAAKGARVSIQRDRAGKYTYERLPADTARSRPFNLAKVSFTDLTVVYGDQQPDDRLEFDGCNGELTDMRTTGGEPLVKHLSLNGKFKCAALKGPGLDKNRVVTDVNFTVVAKQGVFDIDPITVQAYGGQGVAKIRIDRSLDVPTLTVSASLPKFRVEELLKPSASGKSVSGLLNFSANLSMRGATQLAIRQSAQGDMSLSGASLKLSGIDLDQQLQKFALSQSLNLLDVSALLFVGPISLVVTKGIEISNLTKQPDASTSIRNLISRWKVEKGVAHGADVALTTNENRIAVRGDLNFVSNQYQGIVVALVDANGCAKARQNISGPFSKPIAAQSNILLPLGPVLRLLDSAKAFFSGGPDKCEVFYSGSLQSPK